MRRIVFRVEGNAEIGMGHVSRCLTLARALQKRGARVGIICSDVTFRAARGKIVGVVWKIIPQQLSERQDAQMTVAQLVRNPFDILVVDHYGLGAAWEKAVRPHVAHLMAIDDLARAHVGDVLLDQNYHSLPAQRYKNKLPATARTFLGPRYALMRETVRKPYGKRESQSGKGARLFVCLGGSDPHAVTGKIVEELAQLIDVLGRVDVVVGIHYPDINALRTACEKLSNVVLHVGHRAPEQLMHEADIGIGAGGVMMWERCAAELPGLVISIAENQREGCVSMAKVGHIAYLGHYDTIAVGDIAKALADHINHPEPLKAMACRSRALVDGRGAERIARELMHD